MWPVVNFIKIVEARDKKLAIYFGKILINKTTTTWTNQFTTNVMTAMLLWYSKTSLLLWHVQNFVMLK